MFNVLFIFHIGAEDGEKYLAGIIVLAIFVIILLVSLLISSTKYVDSNHQRQTRRTRARTKIIQKIFMKILTKSKMMQIMNKWKMNSRRIQLSKGLGRTNMMITYIAI
jgi:Na+-transporting NADH:ubiquinone oxidoreductase subunit NqrC